MNVNKLEEYIKKMREPVHIDEPNPNYMEEIQEITNFQPIPALLELLNQTKSKKTRSDIYFLLGHFGGEKRDLVIAKFLVEKLKVETDKSVLTSLFIALKNFSRIEDYEVIVTFVSDKRWSIRHDAIMALGNCQGSLAEDTLIRVISESDDPFDLYYANTSLFEIGTPKSIPYLIKLVHHSKADVACTAIGALSEIGDSSLVPIFLDALKSKSADVKSAAIFALVKHGDIEAIEPICKRVEDMLKRKRKIESIPSELVETIKFLDRYLNKADCVQPVFDKVIKKWDYLFESEKEWLKENIAYFKQISLGSGDIT